MTLQTGIISHVEIYVSDLEKSMPFWKELLESLGYTKFQQWNVGISWKLNKTYIVLVQTEKKHLTISYHRKRTGLNHIAFYVNSEEKLDEIVNKLEMHGIKILYDDRFRKKASENPYSIFFEDPDRIKVELVVAN